jgi:hypothetical protein
VGGYTRFKPAEISKMVDAVMAAQITRLGDKLGVLGKASVAAPGVSTPAAKRPADRKAANAAFDAAMADKARAKPSGKAPPKPKP